MCKKEATQAVIKQAMLPAIIDLKAIDEKIFDFCGANELRVAIWMAIEPKFEKPQIA